MRLFYFSLLAHLIVLSLQCGQFGYQPEYDYKTDDSDPREKKIIVEAPGTLTYAASGNISVRLSQPPREKMEISLTSSSPAVTLQPNRLVFTSANYDQPQQAEISVTNQLAALVTILVSDTNSEFDAFRASIRINGMENSDSETDSQP